MLMKAAMVCQLQITPGLENTANMISAIKRALEEKIKGL